MQACEVDGRPPSTAADIDLCLRAVSLQSLRQRMLTSWHNQLARVGGAELATAVPEDIAGRFRTTWTGRSAGRRRGPSCVLTWPRPG